MAWCGASVHRLRGGYEGIVGFSGFIVFGVLLLIDSSLLFPTARGFCF